MLVALLALAVSADQSEKFGRVVLALGNVTAQQGGNAARALKAGDAVFMGDKVATDFEGRAKLLLDDRSVVSLGPKSEMELTALRSPEVPKTSVKLLFGRLWANVQKIVGADAKFDVATPNAVAGVRGTSFMVEAGPAGSSFTVINGTVVVNDKLLQALQQMMPNGNISTLPPTAISELVNSFSQSGQMTEGERLARLEALDKTLNPPTNQGDNFLVPNNNASLPPVNLDPAQTSQTTLIRAHVEVVPPQQ